MTPLSSSTVVSTSGVDQNQPTSTTPLHQGGMASNSSGSLPWWSIFTDALSIIFTSLSTDPTILVEHILPSSLHLGGALTSEAGLGKALSFYSDFNFDEPDSIENIVIAADDDDGGDVVDPEDVDHGEVYVPMSQEAQQLLQNLGLPLGITIGEDEVDVDSNEDDQIQLDHADNAGDEVAAEVTDIDGQALSNNESMPALELADAQLALVLSKSVHPVSNESNEEEDNDGDSEHDSIQQGIVYSFKLAKVNDTI
ncbi:hypothetical protein HDU76_011675, partial [Blyttiomyces sp. JEL0837]